MAETLFLNAFKAVSRLPEGVRGPIGVGLARVTPQSTLRSVYVEAQTARAQGWLASSIPGAEIAAQASYRDAFISRTSQPHLAPSIGATITHGFALGRTKKP